MEGEWRKSPALAKKEMERVMLNLTETMSRDRAMTSIKFLISMYRYESDFSTFYNNTSFPSVFV